MWPFSTKEPLSPDKLPLPEAWIQRQGHDPEQPVLPGELTCFPLQPSQRHQRLPSRLCSRRIPVLFVPERLPSPVQRWLRYVAPAVRSALVAPTVLAPP